MKEIPEELLPVIEWWEKNGKQAIVTVVVAAVVAAGYYGFKSHQESQRKAASSALVSSRTLAQLETASNEFGGSKAGPSIKLRLAKEYYDAGQYESAMNLYKELSGKAPEGFAEAPAIGIAYCLEATEKYDEAAKAFEACAQDEKSLYFLTAKLGVARCTAAAGDKAKALADLEALKASKEDDALAKSRIEAAIDLVKRWEKRAEVIPETVAPAAEAEKSAEPAPKAE